MTLPWKHLGPPTFPSLLPLCPWPPSPLAPPHPGTLPASVKTLSTTCRFHCPWNPLGGALSLCVSPGLALGVVLGGGMELWPLFC